MLMWPLKKKVKQRRLEVRKKIPQAGPMLWTRFQQAGGVGSVLLAVLLCLIVILLDVSPVDPFPYRIGQYVPRTIHSRVYFKDLSQALLDKQVDLTRGSTPAHFDADEHRIDQIILAIKQLPGKLQATTQPKDLSKELQTQFDIQPGDLAAWVQCSSEEGSKKFAQQLDRLRNRMLEICLADSQEVTAQLERRSQYVILETSQGDKKISKLDMISTADKGRILVKCTALSEEFDRPIRRNVLAYLKNTLVDATLYTYNADVTQQQIERAERLVRLTPPLEAYEEYPAGKKLVDRGENTIPGNRGLAVGEYELLQKEHNAWLKQQTARSRWGKMVGRASLIALIIAAMCLYVYRYQPRIVRNHWRGLAIVALMSLMLLGSKTMVLWVGWNPHTAVGVVLTFTLIMVITYNQRFAMSLGTVLAVLVTAQLRGGLELLLVLLTSAAGCCFLLNEVRTRTKLIEISALCALAVFGCVWGIALATGVPPRFATKDGIYGVGFALLAGFLVQGILPLIERFFGVATSMTLLEWCDASKPLLRRLAMQAPGTYNHSLQLGAMCEAAADSIGARGLLARVGAYYHDIGKMNKPEYFIENQGAKPSKHEKLSPAMSLLIIIGHVKDGIEMAREYNLPPILHEFIATHHGTTLVQYFYQAATQQRKEAAERAPDEVEFRYPGPKPQMKEAAILMLADAAESSVRAMDNPTPGRIENQVHAMVSRRLMDGQFDECELTLREVHQIEESLVKSLCGIYHSRIAYPTPPGEKPSAAELPRNGKSNDSHAPVPSGAAKPKEPEQTEESEEN